ncbi:MAG TPA: glucose-1-phosphate adenylyltransferase [Dehalococcoidales bacterium]
MDGVLTMIMAGGFGERLLPLTKDRSKAAVPFGGKFRIIDFTLSNCVNSGIRNIFVLTQYRSESLHRHIQEAWGISSARLGDYIYCVPPQQKLGADWYRGTADAVRQNLDLIRRRAVDTVLILSGDHIYKMNYAQMIDFHRSQKANITISAVRVRKEEAVGQLGVIEIDNDYHMVGFEEKPINPKNLPYDPDYAMVSMGVYAFDVDTLMKSLEGYEDDFGKQIIPNMLNSDKNIFVYDFQMKNKIADYATEVVDGKRRRVLVERTRDSSYWRDVGTIDSYYEASMDLIGVDPIFNLYGERWPIRTFTPWLAPSKFVLGGMAFESLISSGSIISGGTIRNSIISPNVIVERGAMVTDSVIFDDTIIEPDVRINRAIVDKQCVIEVGASIGYNQEVDRKRGFYVSPGGIVVIPKGTTVNAVFSY